jgi:23S rRNA (uridine2552-2'-O)-methyltransferase
MLQVRLRTAKGRKIASTKWLERQLNDPYVKAAKAAGYRSRAAFKLIDLDDQFNFLKKGCAVVDLGATPGGWTQVAVARVKALEKGGGRVIAVDINPMEEVHGAEFILQDFTEECAPARIKTLLGGKAHVVLSDMAYPSSGHPPTDHLRILYLCALALDFAKDVLYQGGTFVAKVLKGGAENEMMQELKQCFAIVRHVKPPSSRPDSAEMYVIAMNFRLK